MLYIVVKENICAWSQPGTLLERVASSPDGMSLYSDGLHKFYMIDYYCELIGKI